MTGMKYRSPTAESRVDKRRGGHKNDLHKAPVETATAETPPLMMVQDDIILVKRML